MIDVKNLNDVIEEFEKEVKNIKTISSVVEDLDKVRKKVELNQELQEKVTIGMIQIKKDLDKSISVFEEHIKDTKSVFKEINATIERNQKVLLIVVVVMSIINITLNHVL